ncbi:UPF0548 protein At2g17695-like isoform X1 [Quercus robur]|uniref:UPF0548 protein At2g17695-like isoform X1 n=1 Tax=Quercus robur TaxID=38942 RepID=UPI002161398E|nr:UPF0548 protein At2g17695-like isoform X1 [Quercus robur]
MVFLCWARPSPQEQKACINKSGAFNYDAKFRGATAKPLSCLQEDKELSKDGFLLNHARVLVGSGLETFEKGKSALQTWRHFGLDWAFVDSKTPIQNGVKFCVCLKEFLPWMMMPLQVVYVNDKRKANKAMVSFGFGSGTLQGHLLAGEERFSIELDENNQVWNKKGWLMCVITTDHTPQIHRLWVPPAHNAHDLDSTLVLCFFFLETEVQTPHLWGMRTRTCTWHSHQEGGIKMIVDNPLYIP